MARSKIPKMKDIFSGKKVKVPKKAGRKHAVITSMLAYIQEHKNSMTPDKWQAACGYVNSFPADYAASFYQNVMLLDIDKMPLFKTVSFRLWMEIHMKPMMEPDSESLKKISDPEYDIPFL